MTLEEAIKELSILSAMASLVVSIPDPENLKHLDDSVKFVRKLLDEHDDSKNKQMG